MKKKYSKSDISITENFIDLEGDELKCKFNFDNSIEIDTSNYSYIILSMENLENMIYSIEKSEKIYTNYYNKIKNKYEKR